jgi:hypothetical protein
MSKPKLITKSYANKRLPIEERKRNRLWLQVEKLQMQRNKAQNKLAKIERECSLLQSQYENQQNVVSSFRNFS